MKKFNRDEFRDGIFKGIQRNRGEFIVEDTLYKELVINEFILRIKFYSSGRDARCALAFFDRDFDEPLLMTPEIHLSETFIPILGYFIDFTENAIDFLQKDRELRKVFSTPQLKGGIESLDYSERTRHYYSDRSHDYDRDLQPEEAEAWADLAYFMLDM